MKSKSTTRTTILKIHTAFAFSECCKNNTVILFSWNVIFTASTTLFSPSLLPIQTTLFVFLEHHREWWFGFRKKNGKTSKQQAIYHQVLILSFSTLDFCGASQNCRFSKCFLEIYVGEVDIPLTVKAVGSSEDGKSEFSSYTFETDAKVVESNLTQPANYCI